MKQKSVKIGVMLVVVLMILAMFSTVALADNTALPPATGNLTIHKYIMDDVSQAALPNDGNPAGTGTNPAVPASAKPLNGITFNLYKITPNPATGALPGVGPYTLSGTTLTDGAGASFTVAAAATPSITTAGGTLVNPAGEATASNLPQGYYLVVEQTSALVASPADPFVVAVPMTNPNGEGWIQNVHVYPKNEDISVEKKPTTTTSVAIGSTMSFEIISSIPTGIYSTIPTEDAKIKYSVTDTLDSALTLNAASIKVYGLTTKTGVGVLIPSSNYTVSGSFTVAMNATGRKLLHDNGYKFLSIKFDTVVNEGILSKPNQTVENKAQVDFTNKFGEDKSKESDPVKVHTASVDLTKEDASTAAKLAGAEFQISSSLANAQNGVYLKKLPSSHPTRPNGIVDQGDPDYASAQPWIATSAVTTGIASFDGLKDYTSTFLPDGTENKTYLSYYIVETKAPTGYNLLDAPITVTFSEANSTETNSYTIASTVKDTNKFTLPKTGGMGTILFTVGGIAIIGIAVILIATSKKKKQSAK